MVNCLKKGLPLLKRIKDTVIQKVLENYVDLGIEIGFCYQEPTTPGQVYLSKPKERVPFGIGKIEYAKKYGYSFPGIKSSSKNKDIVKVECGITDKPQWKVRN